MVFKLNPKDKNNTNYCIRKGSRALCQALKTCVIKSNLLKNLHQSNMTVKNPKLNFIVTNNVP